MSVRARTDPAGRLGPDRPRDQSVGIGGESEERRGEARSRFERYGEPYCLILNLGYSTPPRFTTLACATGWPDGLSTRTDWNVAVASNCPLTLAINRLSILDPAEGLVTDYKERFAQGDEFDTTVVSARFRLPAGTTYRLFRQPACPANAPAAEILDLVGTGHVVEIPRGWR